MPVELLHLLQVPAFQLGLTLPAGQLGILLGTCRGFLEHGLLGNPDLRLTPCPGRILLCILRFIFPFLLYRLSFLNRCGEHIGSRHLGDRDVLHVLAHELRGTDLLPAVPVLILLPVVGRTPGNLHGRSRTFPALGNAVIHVLQVRTVCREGLLRLGILVQTLDQGPGLEHVLEALLLLLGTLSLLLLFLGHAPAVLFFLTPALYLGLTPLLLLIADLRLPLRDIVHAAVDGRHGSRERIVRIGLEFRRLDGSEASDRFLVDLRIPHVGLFNRLLHGFGIILTARETRRDLIPDLRDIGRTFRVRRCRCGFCT